jgi:hypothetical protein
MDLAAAEQFVVDARQVSKLNDRMRAFNFIRKFS